MRTKWRPFLVGIDMRPFIVCLFRESKLLAIATSGRNRRKSLPWGLRKQKAFFYWIGVKDVVSAGFHSCVGLWLRCPSVKRGQKWSVFRVHGYVFVMHAECCLDSTSLMLWFGKCRFLLLFVKKKVIRYLASVICSILATFSSCLGKKHLWQIFPTNLRLLEKC